MSFKQDRQNSTTNILQKTTSQQLQTTSPYNPKRPEKKPNQPTSSFQFLPTQSKKQPKPKNQTNLASKRRRNNHPSPHQPVPTHPKKEFLNSCADSLSYASAPINPREFP